MNKLISSIYDTRIWRELPQTYVKPCAIVIRNIDFTGKDKMSNKELAPDLTHLYENSVVKTKMFSQYGLHVDQVGFDSEDEDRLDVIVQISDEPSSSNEDIDELIDIKVNLYDKNDRLLCVDSDFIDLSEFGGFDTLCISFDKRNIVSRAHKAVIYAVIS